MNAIVPAPAPLAYADLERLGASIARSGLFGIKTTEQAIALMMISQAEGRHPALAARDYDIIQNKPTKKAEAMLRDFLDAGGKVEWHSLTDELADATFSHPKGGTARIDWDMERAKKAQLNGKDMYKKFPRQMLRSRVVSEGVRTVWPLATSGMYVPEEARDIPDEPPFKGTTIDGAPEQPAVQSEPEAAPAAPAKLTVGLWIDKTLPLLLLDCTTTAELEAWQRDNKVYAAAMQKASDSERRDMLARILERAGALMSDDADAAGPADLEIIGEEKVGAG